LDGHPRGHGRNRARHSQCPAAPAIWGEGVDLSVAIRERVARSHRAGHQPIKCASIVETLGTLAAYDAPGFVFCATNLRTGILFRLSKAYAGDYVLGRLDKPNLPLSTAVTASSAFPPFLSPLVLTVPQGSFSDWPGAPAGASRFVDPVPYRARVLLSDGGVYDNHMTLLVNDGGAPFGRTADFGTEPIRQLQRVLDVSDNQVRSLRRRDLIARLRRAMYSLTRLIPMHASEHIGASILIRASSRHLERCRVR
jgi:hypothetical protein